jgi:phenylacetate-CoA ligase
VNAAVAWWLAAEWRATMALPGSSPAELRTLVDARLRRTLAAARRAPFYRGLLEAAGFDDAAATDAAPEAALAALPLLDKARLRSAGADALQDGRASPRWRSTRSSGSTGTPFRVYYDARAWALLKYLVKWRGRALVGARPTDRIAVLDAISPGTRGGTLPERFARFLTLSVLEPAEEVARQLSDFGPDIVYGLPSALRAVGESVADGGHRIRPRLLFTSGELLTPRAVERLEHAFGCPVFDVYGTSETKEIAFQCKRGRLHINEDVVRVEVVREDGSAAGRDEEGEIVATSLVIRAMPLLRYRTGDRGVIREDPCDCGLTLRTLGVVTGREVDTLTFGDGTRVSPYALTTAVEGIEGLQRFQFLQTGPGSLRVRVEHDPEVARDGLADAVERAVHKATEAAAVATVEFVPELSGGPNAKFRVVVPEAGRDT